MIDYHLHENLPFSIDYENVREPAEAVDRELFKIDPNILLLYSRIDELPHELLDHLAYLTHVDDYDMGFSLDIKRELVKDSLKVHKYKGTLYAVKKVISVLNKEVEVAEWFDTGAKPYTFRLKLGAMQDKDTYPKILKMLENVKNVRSQLEYVDIHDTIHMDDEESKIRVGIATMQGGLTKIPLASPENTEGKISIGIANMNAGLTKINLDYPTREEAKLKAGIVDSFSGIIRIDIDEDDLPEIFKEKNAYITPRIGYAYKTSGKRTVPLDLPENETTKLFIGSAVKRSGKIFVGVDIAKGSTHNLGVVTALHKSANTKINADLEGFERLTNFSKSVLTPKVAINVAKRAKRQINIERPTQSGLTNFRAGLFNYTGGRKIIGCEI